MVKKIFYNSSLPRAGSTLIQNILAQNPLIHSTPTSGIYDLFHSSRGFFSNAVEFNSQDTETMQKGFRGYLRGALYGFYDAIVDRPYVFEKCRGWGMDYKFINEFDPNPKIICMIRDLRAIYASMEKKYRNNPLVETNIANWGELTGTTTDKRIQVWSNSLPVGTALDRLYQIVLEGTHKNILFIKFEDLCVDPKKELQRIYNYIDLPYFEHDFNNIDQYTKEDDKWFGIFGDHIIRGKVEPVKNDYVEVLGGHNCKNIVDNYQWFFNAFNYQQ